VRARALVLALLFGAGVARADEPTESVRRLTLSEAVELARAHSARLGQLRALSEAALAARHGAQAAQRPQLDLSAGYTRQSDVPELTLTLPGLGPRTIFPNLPDVWRTRAALSAPLWTAGRLERAVDAADALRRAAEADVETGQADLEYETAVTYWALLTARASERVLGQALAAYDQHVRDARARHDVGMAARNEVLAVEVERERAELQRLRARTSADVAEADLLRLVGLDPGTRLEPGDPVEAQPQRADPAALAQAALEARAELRALRARVSSAEALVAVQRAAGRPQAQAGAAYDLARPNARVLPLRDEWKGTWNVGVSVTWNAFDGGRVSAAVAQARAQAEALRRQLEDAERRVRLDVTERALELHHAQAALEVAARARVAAEENARVAADRYREGVGSSSDLLDAESALLRAGLDHTAAAAGVRTAEAGLRRAQGGSGAP
jgi:outer membrane protein